MKNTRKVAPEVATIVFDFQDFPCFAAKQKAGLAHGMAVCRLLTFRESKTLGNPDPITWTVTSVESAFNDKAKKIVDFDGDIRAMEDFTSWLRGRHGYAIEKQLRQIHLRIEAELEAQAALDAAQAEKRPSKAIGV